MAEAISDSKWKAQSDARTLMEADEILKDKPRAAKAKGAAKVLVREKKSEVKSLEKVIKQKPVKPYKRKNLKVPSKRVSKRRK